MIDVQFRRDRQGIQEILNSDRMLAALRSVAEPIAATVRAAHPDAEVVVDSYTAQSKGRFSARHAVSIAVLDVRARVWQARDGLLTGAAGANGLEVNADDRVD